jgi:hypothetical protein
MAAYGKETISDVRSKFVYFILPVNFVYKVRELNTVSMTTLSINSPVVISKYTVATERSPIDRHPLCVIRNVSLPSPTFLPTYTSRKMIVITITINFDTDSASAG